MLRRPRKPGKDRLVDWRLMLQTYGFIGIIETVCSFAMAYWYLERQGIPFSALWYHQYSALPDNLDLDYVAGKLTEALSVYFINLVVMQWFNLLVCRTRRLSIFQHPPLFNKHTQNWYLSPRCYLPSAWPSSGSISRPSSRYSAPATFPLRTSSCRHRLALGCSSWTSVASMRSGDGRMVSWRCSHGSV